MTTYSYVKMIVNDNETSCLEIWRNGNTFYVYEYEELVLAASYLKTIAYVNAWKANKEVLKKQLEELGMNIHFIQTIA